MKILVCLAKTPDTTTKINFTADNKKLNSEGVQYILNPYDEWYSLVRALEIKESDPSVEVHLLSVGDESYEAVLRKALALGGDKAFRIDFETDDSLTVAKQIAEFIKKQDSYDIIFTGKETIDYNSGVVGGMISEMLEIPFLNEVTKLIFENNQVILHKEIEGGYQKIESDLPLVLCVQKGLAEQRIPNLKGIISSRSKKIEVVEPAQTEAEKSIVESYELPTGGKSVKLIPADKVAELAKLLHEEAKVI